MLKGFTSTRKTATTSYSRDAIHASYNLDSTGDFCPSRSGDGTQPRRKTTIIAKPAKLVGVAYVLKGKPGIEYFELLAQALPWINEHSFDSYKVIVDGQLFIVDDRLVNPNIKG